MTREFDLISKDAQTSLTEFDTEFITVLSGTADPWAKRIGGYKTSGLQKVVWPIALSAAGYIELKGDLRYRTLASKSFELIPKLWQDGVAELAAVVEAPDFFGWDEEPARMAVEAVKIANVWVKDLLQGTVACWDGKNFFATDHPVNVFDTNAGAFSNLTTANTPLTLANLAAAKTKARKMKGANGSSLGVRLTKILVRPDEEELAKDLRDQQLVVKTSGDGSVDNRHKGTFEIEVGEELTQNAWYGIYEGPTRGRPWVVLDRGAPETTVLGKESAMYEKTRKVGYDSVISGYAGLAMPQFIHRYEFT